MPSGTGERPRQQTHSSEGAYRAETAAKAFRQARPSTAFSYSRPRPVSCRNEPGNASGRSPAQPRRHRACVRSDRELENVLDLSLIAWDDPSRMAYPIYTDREWRRPGRTRVWPRPEHTELLLTWTQGKRVARFGASAGLALLSRRGAQAHRPRRSAGRQPQSLSRVGMPQAQGIRVSALD